MRVFRICALLALAVPPGAFAQSNNAPARAAAATITAQDIKQRIAFLASDSLKGRDTPSPGLEIAAQYVAAQFSSFGLKPAGDSGSYLQRWPYQARKLTAAKVNAELRSQSATRALVYGSEFFVIASPAADSLIGDITFVGTASPATKPNAAFAGKIVAFAVPGAEMNDAWGRNLQTAAIAAISSGARGIVMILDPGFDASDIAGVIGAVGNAATPVPLLAVRNDVASAWLKGTAADMTVVRPADAEPVTVAGAAVSVHTGMEAISSSPPNVVAILEGSDPTLKDTYVVFSAHMDHVGVGRPNEQGDSIFNGADDDASGTSAVIEVAQAFAAMQQRPKRSLIFLTVSGEEKGLLGSAYFAQHLPVPADKIVADINIDMIGRNNPDTTVAIGQEYSSLGATTQEVIRTHPELKLVVAGDLWPEERLFFRSDHYNFAMKKIPAIFFTSGLHKDYHKQSDEPQTIDNDKLARTAQLVFWLGHDLANSSAAPTWTPAGLKAINQGGN